MDTIHYGVADLGRRHAARASTLARFLSGFAHVVVHATGEAHDALAVAHADDPHVSVQRAVLPSLLTPTGAGPWAHGALTGLPERLQREARAARLARSLEASGARLAIVEYDVALARAAGRAGVPVVALDHEGLEDEALRDGLPLRARAALARLVRLAQAAAQGARTRVRTTLGTPTEADVAGAVEVSPLVRPEVARTSARAGAHLVVATDEPLSRGTLDVLCDAPVEVLLHGPAPSARLGALVPRAADQALFAADLAGAAALLTTPSLLRIGEGLRLGKPVLALATEGDALHAAHGARLERSGAGEAVLESQLTHARLARFMVRAEGYARVARGLRHDGGERLVRAIAAALRASASRGGRGGAPRVQATAEAARGTRITAAGALA